mmetsp:Transcript_33681/g.38294  ORF Transcript_33681/g.38294 Transcript_33681/m.38294 type:complete len:355 (+) Transcript_33681:50-1114(+)
MKTGNSKISHFSHVVAKALDNNFGDDGEDVDDGCKEWSVDAKTNERIVQDDDGNKEVGSECTIDTKVSKPQLDQDDGQNSSLTPKSGGWLVNAVANKVSACGEVPGGGEVLGPGVPPSHMKMFQNVFGNLAQGKTGSRAETTFDFDNLQSMFDRKPLDEDGWKTIADLEDRKCHYRESGNTKMRMFRIYKRFENLDARVVFENIFDLKKAMEWEERLKTVEVLEKLDDQSDIVYLHARAPIFFVKDREFVAIKSYIYDPNQDQYLVYMKSVDRPDYKGSKSAVRGQIHLFGVRITQTGPTNSDVIFELLVQQDPKGSIPKGLINTIMGKMHPILLKTVEKVCRKDMEARAKAQK